MVISTKARRTRFLVVISFSFNFSLLYATPLTDAVQNDDLNRIEAEIQAGADINAPDERSYTPVMWAIGTSATDPKRIKNLEFLLEHKPDLDKRNRQGDTAIMFAAQMNNLKAVELLLSENPDLDAQNNFGDTALMLAFQRRANIKLIELLFSKITIPEKTCVLSFEHNDWNGNIANALRRTILMKIVAITVPQLLNELFKRHPFFYDYCKAGKMTFLASKFKAEQSLTPQFIVIIPQSLEELGLKIPESEKQEVEPKVDISSVENKFGFKNLKLLNPEFVASVVEKAGTMNESEFKKILENFTHIINTNPDAPQHPTRFYLVGHGGSKLIAAIPINLFDNFLFELAEIGTEFIYIDTCYAAGSNLLIIQSALEKIIAKQIEEKEKSKKATHSPGINYAIVIQATSDVVTTEKIGNPKAMFLKLDTFLQNPVWVLEFGPGVEKPAITISDVISALGIKDVSALPSIRMPGKLQFFRPINIGNMEIITESRLIEDGVKKILELIAESKNPNKIIADEAKKRLQGPLGINISITPDIKYIQIFPIDLMDFTFVIQKTPKFISKLPGKGQHFIGKIIDTNNENSVEQLIYNSFAYIFTYAPGYKKPRCWFIKSVEIPIRGKITTVKNLAIKLYPQQEIGILLYAYINEKGEYIISEGKGPELQNKKAFESTINEWFKETIPSQETLTEATGGIEITTAEKARLEKEKGSAQALKLIEPRFARTPEDLFNMFMAD